MKNMFRSTRFWVCCFLALVLLSGGILAYRSGSVSGATAVITRDGQELQRIDLSQVTEAYTLRLEHPDGGYNLVLVEHGKIGILEASCPDKVCVEQGKIGNGLTPIVCLPNKVMISIEDRSEELVADTVAG